MRAVTGKPIKLIGLGEKMDALDDFHPQRIANRILGMGDIVALVEKAAENIDAKEALRVAEKMRKGKFDLQDMADQLAMADKMGGMGGIMGLLPGVGKIKDMMAAAKVDDKMLKRQRAIILSMTPQERRNPDVLKASRKKRIAAGAGMKVEDVNRLLKQHRTTAEMMKSMGSGAKRGPMAQMAQMFGMGPGAAMPSQEDITEMQKKFGGNPNLGAGMGLGIPKEPPPGAFAPPSKPAIPGLGKGGGGILPGLGGLNPFGKKK
jgi:signal recognition particle subunit SRP54